MQTVHEGLLLPANLMHNCWCKHHNTSQKAALIISCLCETLAFLWKLDEQMAEINENFYWLAILKLFGKCSSSLTDPLVLEEITF